MFSYDNLINYYKVNFILMQHHKYSLNELEEMMPWERQVYVKQLEQYIEKENERIRNLNNSR